MVLDKKKVRTIVEPFEKEVYETFLKLDKQIEFMEVEIYYHKWHRFEGEATVITDFEIYVRNGGKESLILIECKHHSDAQSNIMKDLEGFAFKLNKVKQEYSGTETAVKPLFLIEVDSGEDIPGPVVNEALKNGIPCYGSLLISQFNEAIDSLSPSVAFLEFLHSYIGEDPAFDPPKITCRCLVSPNFEKPTYTFSMPANDLIRVAYVNRANINKPDLAEAYQRAVKSRRLSEIAKFVVEESRKSKIEVFPNNLVANIKDFTFVPDQDGSNFGTITFQNRYGALWIIDGQHRLYSFSKIQDEIRSRYSFIVTAYPNISLSDQAEIFYTINDKQEGINPDLIMFIQAHLLEKTEGYAAKVLLEIDKEDFFTKPIKKGFEERERGAWLKLSTIVNTIKEEGLISYEKSGGGLLQRDKDDLETPTRILREYMDFVRHHFRTSWDDGRKGFAQSNQGLSILLIILARIVKNETKSKDDLDDIGERAFERYLGSINSQTLDTRKLISKQLRDVRNKTDRREAANAIWDMVR